MDADKLVSILESFQDSYELIENYGYTSERLYHDDIKTDELEKIVGEIEYVQVCKRSSFGDHDTVETVIYFKEHNIYLLAEGYYSSQEGASFDSSGWEEVEKKTKKVTYYA